MQEKSENENNFTADLRRLIVTVCVFCLVLSFPSCMNVVTGYETFVIPIAFLLLFVSTILSIIKIKIGFILLLIVSIIWAFWFEPTLGLVFVSQYNSFLRILLTVVPFLLYLLLIPLTVKYLTVGKSYSNPVFIISIIFTTAVAGFSVTDRYNRDYKASFYGEFVLHQDDTVDIVLKPQISDGRKIYLKTESRQLAAILDGLEKSSTDRYYVSETHIILNYNFAELQTIKLVGLGEKRLPENIVWTQNEISGDTKNLME